jgi:hypothetical protein
MKKPLHILQLLGDKLHQASGPPAIKLCNVEDLSGHLFVTDVRINFHLRFQSLTFFQIPTTASFNNRNEI